MIGIFGGAFDPPHQGHVELVRAATQALGLERVVVVVVADPGHKRVETPAAVRFEMARAAFPDAEVVLDEHPRTIDMLRAHPEWQGGTLLIGADELAVFSSWKEPDEILKLVRLGIATRRGHEVELGDPERMSCFEIDVPVASRDVRARLEAGEEVGEGIPAAVLEIIRRDALYQHELELH